VAVTRLAEDRRARVPFALVGVLLLVGATTFAATVSFQGPSRVDRDVDAAMERTTAGTTAVLRSAVAEAAREAAAEPVTEPAETRYGQELSGSRPFRDSLRLRIYLTLRERLPTTRHRRGDATAVASVRDVENPADLRRALDDIELAGVENGTALRVTVRNLTVTAREDGRVVAQEWHTRQLTVATPVLAVHDRTVRFEERLNRGPLAGAGLGRRLTGRLYPVVWARGYAQYRNLPITNVLANRHVEVSTNGALLGAQRAAFGRSDPAARRGTVRAMARLGVRDAAATTRLPAWAEQVVPRPNARRNGSPALPRRALDAAPSPERTITVDAGTAAGRSLVGLESDALASDRSLAAVFRSVYRVETRLRTTVRETRSEPRPEPTPPGETWELAETDTGAYAETSYIDGPTPTAGEGRRLLSYARHVTVHRRVEWTWERGDDTLTTRAAWRERYRVGVTLVGEYAPTGPAPDRPTRPLFERGGALDGPNLADVPAKAEAALIDEQGGPDAVAAAAARDRLDTRTALVHADRPADLRSWVYGNLSALHARLGNVSVDVEAGAIATYTANPARRLSTRVEGRRAELVGAPVRYDGVADRARVAARVAMLNGTVDGLNRRAAIHEDVRGAVGTVVGRSPATLRRLLDSRHEVRERRQRPVVGGPPTGNVTLVPDGSPAYLTVASVDHGRATGVPPEHGYHPLAIRNVNLFTAPYADGSDAASTVVDGTPAADRARLRTAAQVIAETDGSAAASSRPDLRDAVSAAMDPVRDRAVTTVHAETNLTRDEAEAAVEVAMGRWGDTGTRGLAATNGSLARAVSAVADRRADGRSAERRARLETRLGVAINETLQTEAATVPEGLVVAVAERLQEGDGGRGRTTRKSLAALPAGFPVLPTPAQWYATVNVWTVSVRGAYARFTVRTGRGVAGPGTALRYVRDGSTVTLDVDGDGTTERLGRDERVEFETGTAVAVAVPRGKRGVGDVEGGVDERSPGWPGPNCTAWVRRSCRAEKPFVDAASKRGMLYDAVEEPGQTPPPQLRDAYETQLRAVIDARGIESVAEEADLPVETVAEVASGGSPTLTLADAAAILAIEDPNRDATAIVKEVRDHLLMGMTTGVLDVDTIASNVDLDLSGQEVQQAIEGRTRMTLEELAAIHGYVASRNN
jgi:hypothetical protein